MSNNTQPCGQWTGHQNTVTKKESAGNGHQNNWSGQSNVVWGGQHNRQNGQIATGYNGHIAPQGYSYNGHSASAAYSHNGPFYVFHMEVVYSYILVLLAVHVLSSQWTVQ